MSRNDNIVNNYLKTRGSATINSGVTSNRSKNDLIVQKYLQQNKPKLVNTTPTVKDKPAVQIKTTAYDKNNYKGTIMLPKKVETPLTNMVLKTIQKSLTDKTATISSLTPEQSKQGEINYEAYKYKPSTIIKDAPVVKFFTTMADPKSTPQQNEKALGRVVKMFNPLSTEFLPYDLIRGVSGAIEGATGVNLADEVFGYMAGKPVQKRIKDTGSFATRAAKGFLRNTRVLGGQREYSSSPEVSMAAEMVFPSIAFESSKLVIPLYNSIGKAITDGVLSSTKKLAYRAMVADLANLETKTVFVSGPEVKNAMSQITSMVDKGASPEALIAAQNAIDSAKKGKELMKIIKEGTTVETFEFKKEYMSWLQDMLFREVKPSLPPKLLAEVKGVNIETATESQINKVYKSVVDTYEPPVIQGGVALAGRDKLIELIGVTDASITTVQGASRAFNKYIANNAQTALKTPGIDNKDLIRLDIVEYSDKKWGYALEINAESTGLTSPYLKNGLFNTQEEAISTAKKQTNLWVSMTPTLKSEEAEMILSEMAKPIDYKPSPKELIKIEQEVKTEVVKDIAREKINMFSKEDYKLFDKVKMMASNKNFTKGDVESMRGDLEGKMDIAVNKALERYKEVTGLDLSDDEAFEAIKNLPSRSSLVEQVSITGETKTPIEMTQEKLQGEQAAKIKEQNKLATPITGEPLPSMDQEQALPETTEGQEDIFNIETKRAPVGMASGEGGKIGGFEKLSKEAEGQKIKLYEEVKALIKKYAKSIGENYTSPGAVGTYYSGTKNIRIKGMNDLAVAAHEITHYLDFAYKISDQLKEVAGYGKNGNPIYSRATASFRKELTDIYKLYYPGAKSTHSLTKRLLEGYATLLEHYIQQPTLISDKFPNLVKEFLTEGGKFYKPVIGELIKDVQEIVAKYQALSPLEKVGTRIINDEVNVNKDSFLNIWDKIKTQIADNIYPIEKLAKKAGVHFTSADPSLWLRQYNNSNTIILNNLAGRHGYWGWRNGEMVKLHDFNWKTLEKSLTTEQMKEFGNWLVARREYFAFEELKVLRQNLMDAKSALEQAEFAPDIEQYKAILSDAREKYNNAKEILSKDGFMENEVKDAYLDGQDKFKKQAEMFDALTREDLNFLHDVGLINDEEFASLSSKEGYASFKRYFYDEIVGEKDRVGLGLKKSGKKVGSLIARHGSQAPIVNPMLSGVLNHAEITKKGLQQIVYNKIYEISDQFPELFQKVKIQAVPDARGKISFPQEKDPNIIMARKGGKRVAILTDATIKSTIDNILTPQSLHYLEKLLMASSRLFTKGTTGLFPAFAVTNATVDTITLAAQTRNKVIPIYDALKTVLKSLKKDNIQHQYFIEYLVLGGERQTIVGWQDMTPSELHSKIANERKGLLKVLDYIDKGADLLAMPTQWSEVASRATEYVKARMSGKPEIVAIEEAGRVTAPFHHIGSFGGGRVGQTLIKSIPFFNPGIQVIAQTAETLKNSPASRRRFLFIMAALTAGTIAGFISIQQFGSDTQKQAYSDLAPEELEGYIWFPKPDGKTLGRIRVPNQMNVIATLINMAIADKTLNTRYSAREYIDAVTGWLPRQVNVFEPEKMFWSWMPQLIKPLALVTTNKKDFPNIQPLETQGMEARSPGKRFTSSTSPVAKWVGETFNISPIKFDYLLTNYAGRFSGFFTGKTSGFNPLSSLSREYYFTAGRNVQKFYDIKKTIDEKYSDMINKRSTPNISERAYIIKKHNKVKNISAMLTYYGKLDEVKDSDKIEEQRKKILEAITDLKSIK